MWLAVNSAEIKPVGIKNKMAAVRKKKTKVGPNEAAKGRFRMLSMETVISITKLNNDNVFFLLIFMGGSFDLSALDTML